MSQIRSAEEIVDIVKELARATDESAGSHTDGFAWLMDLAEKARTWIARANLGSGFEWPKPELADCVKVCSSEDAQRIAELLWDIHGVTHDPRVYKCHDCGIDCRRDHDHMTLGHATRLCSGCFNKRGIDPNDVIPGYVLPEKAERVNCWPNSPRKSLLDLCCEFDAVDLSECNRRLEAGEAFDAACEEAMERREKLAGQIQKSLGPAWEEFEQCHEELNGKFPNSKRLAEHALAAIVARTMIDVREFFMFGNPAGRIVAGLPIDDDKGRFGLAIRAMRRMMTLIRALGLDVGGTVTC